MTGVTPTRPEVPASVIARLRNRDERHVWHPWSPADAPHASFMITSGSGSHVRDSQGRVYLDCSSLNTTVGYGCQEVIEAIRHQLSTLPGLDISTASHPLAGELAERLAQLLPAGHERFLFVNSGSEAWEAALFIAAAHWQHCGEDRTRFVTFAAGYHGSTLASRTLSGLPRVVQPFGQWFAVDQVALPAPARDLRTPLASAALLAAFAEAIDREPTPPAAVIVEPFINVGGGIELPEGFLPALAELCRQRQVLLAVDEVFTAYGRCGAITACGALGVSPDILVTSKGLAGGYAGIATVSVQPHIQQMFAKDPLIGGLRYGHTTSGHAGACAAALATLTILERDDLAGRSRLLGAHLKTDLQSRLAGSGAVDVRGLGLAVVVELADPAQAMAVRARARESGLLVRGVGSGILISPPLTVSGDEIDHAAHILETCIGTVSPDQTAAGQPS